MLLVLHQEVLERAKAAELVNVTTPAVEALPANGVAKPTSKVGKKRKKALEQDGGKFWDAHLLRPSRTLCLSPCFVSFASNFLAVLPVPHCREILMHSYAAPCQRDIHSVS